ncbi:MAG: DNA adenine methylase [Chloroflexia bacterium]|nr:DNA adenine methylase [Chloroflexia bacterium]
MPRPAMLNATMNYIGSKHSLLDDIAALLDEQQVPAEGRALDLFAGTAAVAQLLKRRGHVTYANDWQYYSYVTGVAFIEFNSFPKFETLLTDGLWGGEIRAAAGAGPIRSYSIEGRGSLPAVQPCGPVLHYLNRLPGRRGTFYASYCQGGEAGRMYFARENGLRIQAIRDQVEDWGSAELISPREKAWLVACLLESADRVANTASVYGAYLKHVKKAAQKPLALVALKPIPSAHPAERHRVFCQDGLELLGQFDPGELHLVYVDPPYNHRQYASNYHLLETIARWDLGQFEPRGVTGLRKARELCSNYCLGSAVESEMRRLLQRVNSHYLLLSYNNEGLLPPETLLALLEEFCTEVRVAQIHYRRFRADTDHAKRNYKADHTREFLVLGRPKTRPGCV